MNPLDTAATPKPTLLDAFSTKFSQDRGGFEARILETEAELRKHEAAVASTRDRLNQLRGQLEYCTYCARGVEQLQQEARQQQSAPTAAVT